jgi:hypothetical protein
MLLVTVAFVMAAMMVVMVAPAFARANDNASCPGRAASDANSQSPGAGGALISSVANSDPGSIGEAASEGCI